ncbi:MAG: OmpA family protein [Phycisphaerae bacterium]|nr:OmpA family protein [Phycisphaerae bacterium]
MRTYVGTALSVVMVALVAGGCVPKAKLDSCRAANRRMEIELNKAHSALRTVRDEKQDLSRDLDMCRGEVKSKQADIEILEAAKADLQDKFDELSDRYQKLLDEPLPPETGPISISALPTKVDAALKAFAAANPELLEYLPKYGMVKFQSDLTFELGSDYVQDDAQEALARFVEILQTDAAQDFNVFVAGHTDNVPIKKAATKRRHPDNWYLSVHRAVAVQQILQAAGLDPERIGAMGFGEHHPIAPNKPGGKGNKVNRRVEIWILSKDRFLTPEAVVGTDGGD